MRTAWLIKVLMSVVLVGGSGAVLAQASRARVLEQEEQANDALREHCRGLNYRRMNAASSGAWRDLVNTSKSFADACSAVEDRFEISRAYEDMTQALMNLHDPIQALRWAQACMDQNNMAIGCMGRKAEIVWQQGKLWEARAILGKAIMMGERAIGLAKVEIERIRFNKPNPRAESIYRVKYLRKLEQLDARLSLLEESLRTVKDMQDGLDAVSGDAAYR